MAGKASSPGAKVGVFMPYYNMGNFINESLDSLRKQTFQDFTVIIADDASTQKDALSRLTKIKDRQYKVFYERKNLGLIRISNKYMEKLDAEYIMLFSPDDKMHPDFLQEQVDYLDSHPGVHAVCTWIQEFDGGHDLIKYSDESCKLPHMLVTNNFSGAALMRKSAWLAAGKHDTHKNLYPNLDYDLWLSMLAKGFKLGTIAKPLFYWRVRHSSLSHDMDAQRMRVFRKALLKKYSALYKQFAEYVIDSYLDKLSEFENYYAISEEGHNWLDTEYKKQLAANASLLEHINSLTSRLDHSIERPYTRSVFRKLRSRLKRR